MGKIYRKIMLLLVISFSGCDNFLDVEPVSVITGSSFWQTQDDAEAGVISAYNHLQLIARKESGGLPLWGSARSDEMKDSGQGLIAEYFTNSLRPTTARGIGWEDLYLVINQANLAIKNIPDVSMNEDTRDSFLGEARFLRAMSYFYLVRLWGDVPLLLEPLESPDEDLKPLRSPKADVYAAIEDDLDFAVLNLPESRNGVYNRVRATIGAVKALQLDYYLWMARVEGGGAADLSKAIGAAEYILDDAMNYDLVDDYASIFSDRESEEIIFAIHFDVGNQETGNYGGDAFGAEFGTKHYFTGSKKLADAFEPGDIRKDATLYSIPNSSPVYDESDGIEHQFIKYLDGETADVWGFRNFDRSIILYRVAGIKLMLAEAYNESGNTSGAIDELNDVRERANLVNTTAVTQEEVRQAILDEGLVELSYESSRWFTLIRSGRVMEEVAAINSNTFSNDTELVLPIHQTAIRQNEKLVQNKFYQ